MAPTLQSLPITSKRDPLAWVLCLVVYLASDSLTKGDDKLDEILNRYQASCNSIDTCDALITTKSHILLVEEMFTHRPEAGKGFTPSAKVPSVVKFVQTSTLPNSAEHEYVTVSRQRFKQDRLRLDLQSYNGKQSIPDQYVQVWNLETARVFNAQLLQGQISNAAATGTSCTAGICFYDLYRNFNGDYTYLSFIRDRATTEPVITTTGSFVTVEVRSSKTVRGSPFGAKLTLDTNKGYLPSQIGVYKGNAELPYYTIENKFRELSHGFWVPSESLIRMFVHDKNSPQYGELHSVTNVSIDASRTEFNKPIDDSIFSLEFPTGTAVTDVIRQVSYVKEANNREERLRHLSVVALDAAKVVRIRRTQRAWTGSRYLAWFVILNGALLVVMLLLYWYRRRRYTMARRDIADRLSAQ